MYTPCRVVIVLLYRLYYFKTLHNCLFVPQLPLHCSHNVAGRNTQNVNYSFAPNIYSIGVVAVQMLGETLNHQKGPVPRVPILTIDIEMMLAI